MGLSETPAHRFPTTAWSVVLAAGCDSAASQQALAALCETYWYPIYGYVRRRGYGTEDARDLTQEFFARLLETHLVGAACPGRGRFRSFLLASVRHFLANEWDRAHARKRGGGLLPLSLNFEAAEGQYQMDPSHDLTPEKLFERGWAVALLGRVVARLRAEFAAKGRERRFELMKPFLASEQAQSTCAELAGRMEVSEGAARIAVYRLRSRYRELLCEEIAQTLNGSGDIEDEIRYLLAALEQG